LSRTRQLIQHFEQNTSQIGRRDEFTGFINNADVEFPILLLLPPVSTNISKAIKQQAA